MHPYGLGIRNPLFFIGAVENVKDPRKEGRIQVRAFGAHGTPKEIPTSELPWAIPIQGHYMASPISAPQVNQWVFGFFLDGEEANQPMILGQIPLQHLDPNLPETKGWGAVPDNEKEKALSTGSNPEDMGQPAVHRLARGENIEETYVLEREMNRIEKVEYSTDAPEENNFSEPQPAYNAEYPYNKVIASHKHSLELDDTKDHERIAVNHHDGSYIEMASGGVTTYKATNDCYYINDEAKLEYVGGRYILTVEGDVHVMVRGNKTEEIMGDYNLKVHGNTYLGSGSETIINSGDPISMAGPQISMHALTSDIDMVAKKNIQAKAEERFDLHSLNMFITADEFGNIVTTNGLNMGATEGAINVKAVGGNLNIETDSDMNLKADGDYYQSGSTTEIYGSTVYIDANVEMASDTATVASEAAEAEVAEDATGLELPEPPAKATNVSSTKGPKPAKGGGAGTGGMITYDDQIEDQGIKASFQVDTESSSSNSSNRASPLLDLIARGESISAGGYTAIQRGTVPTSKHPTMPITSMTIGEVIAWQKSTGTRASAVGRYQMEFPTLTDLVELYNAATYDEVFNTETQDKLAVALMKRRGLATFTKNPLTDKSSFKFAYSLSQEWAALPRPDTPNLSNYGNKETRITNSEVKTAIKELWYNYQRPENEVAQNSGIQKSTRDSSSGSIRQPWSKDDEARVEGLRSFNQELGEGQAAAKLTEAERKYARSKGYIA